MPKEHYKPSPWEHPEIYEKMEVEPEEPKRDRSLREFMEIKLSSAGFAVDMAPGGDILAWPRGTNISEASYIIGQRGDIFVVKSATGAFARSKIKKAMDMYLKQWYALYKMGLRT